MLVLSLPSWAYKEGRRKLLCQKLFTSYFIFLLRYNSHIVILHFLLKSKTILHRRIKKLNLREIKKLQPLYMLIFFLKSREVLVYNQNNIAQSYSQIIKTTLNHLLTFLKYSQIQLMWSDQHGSCWSRQIQIEGQGLGVFLKLSFCLLQKKPWLGICYLQISFVSFVSKKQIKLAQETDS